MGKHDERDTALSRRQLCRHRTVGVRHRQGCVISFEFGVACAHVGCVGGGMGASVWCVSCALEEDKGSSPPSHTWVVRFIDVHDWVLFSCPVGFAVPPLSQLITAPLPVPCSACVRAVFLVLLKERDSATLSRSGSG